MSNEAEAIKTLTEIVTRLVEKVNATPAPAPVSTAPAPVAAPTATRAPDGRFASPPPQPAQTGPDDSHEDPTKWTVQKIRATDARTFKAALDSYMNRRGGYNPYQGIKRAHEK